MACDLTTPSHYLNQCWLIISKVQWDASKVNFMRYLGHLSLKLAKIYLSKMSFKPPRVQWVNTHNHTSKAPFHPWVCPSPRRTGCNLDNTLRLRQNGCHFPDNIFKCIFLNETVWISIKISLKFVPKVPIDNIPALVQVMAWRRIGNKPLSEPMLTRFSDAYIWH